MLAHQGGWDEALFVVGPMLVIVGLLAIARRRVANAQAPAEDEAQDSQHDLEADEST